MNTLKDILTTEDTKEARIEFRLNKADRTLLDEMVQANKTTVSKFLRALIRHAALSHELAQIGSSTAQEPAKKPRQTKTVPVSSESQPAPAEPQPILSREERVRTSTGFLGHVPAPSK